MARKKRSLNFLEISTNSPVHHPLGVTHEDELENHEKSSTASGSYRDGKEIHTETSGIGSGNSEESDFQIGYEENFNNKKYNIRVFSRGASPEAIKLTPQQILLEIYDGFFVGNLMIDFDPLDSRLIEEENQQKKSKKVKKYLKKPTTVIHNQKFLNSFTNPWLGESFGNPRFDNSFGKPRFDNQPNFYQHNQHNLHQQHQLHPQHFRPKEGNSNKGYFVTYQRKQETQNNIIDIPLFTLPSFMSPPLNFNMNMRPVSQMNFPGTQKPQNIQNIQNTQNVQNTQNIPNISQLASVLNINPPIKINNEQKSEITIQNYKEQMRQIPIQSKSEVNKNYSNEYKEQRTQKEITKEQSPIKYKNNNSNDKPNSNQQQKNNQEKHPKPVKKPKKIENEEFKLWDMISVSGKLKK